MIELCLCLCATHGVCACTCVLRGQMSSPETAMIGIFRPVTVSFRTLNIHHHSKNKTVKENVGVASRGDGVSVTVCG